MLKTQLTTFLTGAGDSTLTRAAAAHAHRQFQSCFQSISVSSKMEDLRQGYTNRSKQLWQGVGVCASV